MNPFELQNYYPLNGKHDIEVISSKRPLSDKVNLPLKKLWSPTDIPNIPFKYPLLNRLFIDSQLLYSLEKQISGSDIVHVAETYFGYTYQAIRAKQKGLVKTIISTVWETIPHNNESLRGRKKIKNMARKSIDHFLAVTEKAKKALIAEGISEKKITVIPMGVDLERFKPRKKQKTKRNINILCVARLVPEKGVLLLLEAYLTLKKKYKNLTLTVIGEGPLKSQLLGYKGVFVKKAPYSKMPFEYASSDIFCLPSMSTKTWEEQFGMCLVEAMASGLPVVSTKTGAIPEVCGDVAHLIDPGSVTQLTGALEKLIYNKVKREKMGAASRHLAESRYNLLDIAKKIDLLYQKFYVHKKNTN